MVVIVVVVVAVAAAVVVVKGCKRKEERKRKRKETKAKESRKLYIYTYTTLRSPLRLPWKNHVFLPYRITKVTPPLNLLQGGLERPPCDFFIRKR